MPDDDDLRLAYLATAAWLGTGAALDIALVATKHRPITHALRRPAGVAFLAVLVLHVAKRLGRFDPFNWIAARISRLTGP